MSEQNPDPYARSEYRKVIAWKTRIDRERPFLTEILNRAPDASVLDVGCGTGEHTAFYAQLGARAVGVDRSASMIESAKEHERAGHGRFVELDALGMSQALRDEPPFGVVLCLGNMLPHLLETREVESMFGEIRTMLRSGGLFLLQLLNYRRILDGPVRHLPLNFREQEEGEIVFVRLMQEVSEERILFFPTTLLLDPDADPPVTVQRSRKVELRPWTATDLVPLLEQQGFDPELHGDMKGGRYDPRESSDLVVLARRE